MGKLNLAQFKKIHIQFNPFDPKSISVREFLARISSRTSLEANPKIDISHKLRTDQQPPVVQVVYADGKEAVINCKDKNCEKIISEISLVSGRAELDALMKANGLKGVVMEAQKFF